MFALYDGQFFGTAQLTKLSLRWLSAEVVGPKSDLPGHLLWPCTRVTCMKPRWALFRILRSFNQPGMDHILSSSKVSIFVFLDKYFVFLKICHAKPPWLLHKLF